MRKQVPIRMDEELYKKVRIKLIDKGKTFQQYVLELIEKDMKGEEK